jgi:hypothetical protein
LAIAVAAVVTLFAATAIVPPDFALAREAIIDCAPVGNARPVCGFHNPEDLALLPGGRFAVISQMGRIEGFTPGTIAFYDIETGAHAVAFPLADFAAPPSEGWGDPSCPSAPPKLSPHGLSLGTRPDGKLALLVVNHGREAVEFFEVSHTATVPQLTWRGCVMAPDPLFMNDVVALPDGGFVATHMFPRGREKSSGLKALLGGNTGYVIEWHAGQELHKVAGSDSVMPNGIEASSDGKSLYVAAYLENEVFMFSRREGKITARTALKRPDNLSWSPDGTLLAASHDATLSEMLECHGIEHGACGAGFSIVAIDPKTLATRTLYRNEGPPMGAATSAIRAGDELIIGSNAGDRILRVPFPK